MTKLNQNKIILFYEKLEHTLKTYKNNLEKIWAGNSWYQDDRELEIKPAESSWIDENNIVGSLKFEISEKIQHNKKQNPSQNHQYPFNLKEIFQHDIVIDQNHSARVYLSDSLITQVKNGVFLYEIKASWCLWNRHKSAPWGLVVEGLNPDPLRNLLKNNVVTYKYSSNQRNYQRDISGKLEEKGEWIIVMELFVKGSYFFDIKNFFDLSVILSCLGLSSVPMTIVDLTTDHNNGDVKSIMKLESIDSFSNHRDDIL